MAVSSESSEHKHIRFKLISDIFLGEENFSVHDVGMGLADMYAFLKNSFSGKSFEYSGSEILMEYVEEARKRYPDLCFYHRDLAEEVPEDRYDFVIMSGVFHQRRESSIKEWERFAQHLISNAFSMARKGVAFNFISPFVDFYQTQVYYSNIVKWINFINDELSRFFVINHAYALFEYTVHVYKEEYVKDKYCQDEFRKYFHVT